MPFKRLCMVCQIMVLNIILVTGLVISSTPMTALLGDSTQALQNPQTDWPLRYLRTRCTSEHLNVVLVRDWQETVAPFILGNVALDTFYSFVYLGNCITASKCVGCTPKSGLMIANLIHFWHRDNINLSLKGRAHSATVRVLSLCDLVSVSEKSSLFSNIVISESLPISDRDTK